METLYNLVGQYSVLLDIEEEGFEQALNELKGQIEDKVENIGKLVLSLKASQEVISEETERLNQRREALKKRQDWLKDYLLREMTAAQIKKVQRDVVTVSLRKAPPSCVVNDLNQIPEICKRFIPATWEPDKKMIIERWKATGEIVPGVAIIADKKTVQVR